MPSPWSETGQAPQWRDREAQYEPPPEEGSCQAWVDPSGVHMACRGDRITAALATLDRVQQSTADEGTHDPECWTAHTGCLAARLRRLLTGEAVDGA